jgi:hypothetical protein
VDRVVLASVIRLSASTMALKLIIALVALGFTIQTVAAAKVDMHKSKTFKKFGTYSEKLFFINKIIKN